MLQEATRGIDPHLAQLPGASGTRDATRAASRYQGTPLRTKGPNPPVPEPPRGHQEVAPSHQTPMASSSPVTTPSTKLLTEEQSRSDYRQPRHTRHSRHKEPVHCAARPARHGTARRFTVLPPHLYHASTALLVLQHTTRHTVLTLQHPGGHPPLLDECAVLLGRHNKLGHHTTPGDALTSDRCLIVFLREQLKILGDPIYYIICYRSSKLCHQYYTHCSFNQYTIQTPSNRFRIL
ncbi:hypothetical protein E2C01_064930 [Portunus trituberculatus]|uniref:Uncharacterized protein n=1 Tax=Portunus trituberculatus TaxID=210409 RepID=A0A5B7HQD5_PORTR|nr:hypothetical protein [Portunus trituberculatus]